MNTTQNIDALFLFATEGIIVVDDTGKIIRANPNGAKMFGYQPEELAGKKIEVLIPRRLAQQHVKDRSNFSKNPHPRTMGIGMELSGLRKDGTEFPVEVSLSPYTEDGKKFVISFVIDVTIRKQAEEKLRNYSAELEKQVKNRTMILEEAIDELEKTKSFLHQSLEKERELSELKSRFVSMASHEFRTPLATMMSSLSLVSKYGEQNNTDAQSRHIQKIKSSINNLTEILNDFLSVTKLEEGKVIVSPENFEVREFIQTIVTDMSSLLKEKQKIKYAHSGGKKVQLDKKHLRHIIINLLTNAIKFSEENKRIEISTETGKSYFKLTVTDHGIGMSEADQKHLFERFFRGHNATYIQGTGLGLNIVARYVELMQGKIQFKSKENSGTTITIKFPQ